ncbi:gliding motility protein [Streptomyces sp. R44]|uniref:Gliding motility protein n=1 Tax=Streptomyces sp. R44 TaxID=3238633 RepID=A0AB39T730_9ACTN
MGVFAMFRRKKQGDTGSDATAEAAEAEAPTAAAEDVETDEVTAEAAPAEAVEIPKQQSAEAAADNEAGEGARK